MSARLLLVLLGVSGTAAAVDPIADISRCAAVAGRDERLACYDSLGARYAMRKGTSVAPATPAAAAAPAAAAVPPAPVAQPQPTAPVAKAAASTESRADFGLKANQMPKDPEAPKKLTTIEGVVSGFGRSPDGHQVVRLDDSQSWELLADSDPLLTPGAKVSIRRALLGSFIMTTPSGREHRVKRLTQ
jgi:hypothetical protein